MSRTNLNKISSIYIFLISFSILPALYFTISSTLVDRWPEIVFWILLEVIADFKHIIRYKGGEILEITMSFAVHLSVIILFGAGTAVWIVMIATVIVELILRKPFYKVLFNVGQYGLTVLTSGIVFHALKLSPEGTVLDIVMDMPAIIIGISIYFIVNIALMSGIFSLTSGNSFINIFMSDFKVITSHFYSLAPISVAVSLLYKPERPYIIFIMIPPLIMADQALRRYYSLHQETQETLKVLADIIDERDKYTSAHSVRVSEYARKIAEHMRLSMDEITEIEMAGRVHDLGKVAVEDRILNKNGKLDEEEYNQIKQHPETAYRLLKNLRLYRKGLDFVLYHHERLDGKGYPRRISGDVLPLGARILAVADSYDAMTTDRPYRKALSQDTAVDELRRCVGTQFDPRVVQSFTAVLEKDYGYNGKAMPEHIK